jgi:hypothetical protein
MNRPDHDEREVPEPRLITLHVLVKLKCRTAGQVASQLPCASDSTSGKLSGGTVVPGSGMSRRSSAGADHVAPESASIDV